MAPAAWGAVERNVTAVRYLDVAHATLSQPVDPASVAAGENKFVEVEVVEVVNPAQASLSFEVDFEPAGAPRVRLGTFSLFPANNPGTFIVATQGKLERTGTLIVAMRVNDPVPAGVPLQVGIGRIALSSGLPRRVAFSLSTCSLPPRCR
jgi:hypothetical protein